MVDRPAAVRGVAAAFLALSTIAVLLRCYVRLRIVKAFGWDDGFMILAMVCPFNRLRLVNPSANPAALLHLVLRIDDWRRSLGYRETSFRVNSRARKYCNGGMSLPSLPFLNCITLTFSSSTGSSPKSPTPSLPFSPRYPCASSSSA
jgi:hypothetical protein